MLQILDYMIFVLHIHINVVDLDNEIILLCLLEKFHIHKARALNTKPTTEGKWAAVEDIY